jgi:hypothetical protein
LRRPLAVLALASLLFFALPLARPALVQPASASPSLNDAAGLDCNGWSSAPSDAVMVNHTCADPLNHLDNGWYVGHDEPSLQFFSSVSGSANNLQYSFTLPAADPIPKQDGSQTAYFENSVALWFSLALCDPNSFPEGACTADSDSNVPSAAGSALLELQFYPPGWEPFTSQISCSHTQWCAALNIDSLECTAGFAHCNFGCEEPVNFAFIQTDGVPPGPPGPGAQTAATYTPNANTLSMNPGDSLVVTLQDTASGLKTSIDDLTSSQSGYMVASSGNHFKDANSGTASQNSCFTSSFSDFSFHPEYSTASSANIVPWTALFANVNFAVETGHFELSPVAGGTGDGDSDDAPCFAGPNGVSSPSSVAGCLDIPSGGDLDFDGTSYVSDWPDGTSVHPASFVLGNPVSFSSGTYSSGFANFLFATDVPASENSADGSGTTCITSTGAGCVVPPQNSAHQPVFYPFFSLNSACGWLFGNDVSGQTTNDYGKVAQYGSVNPSFGGTFTSPVHSTPVCAGGGNGVPEFPFPLLVAVVVAFLGVALLRRTHAPLLRVQ